MKNRSWHQVVSDKKHIDREKIKARELKSSTWWKQKIAEGVCHYCGRKFPPEKLTMDHVVPIARGGKSSRGNTVTCCFDCNQNKGLDTPVDMILNKIKKL